jgi:hypothetical protein
MNCTNCGRAYTDSHGVYCRADTEELARQDRPTVTICSLWVPRPEDGKPPIQAFRPPVGLRQ